MKLFGQEYKDYCKKTPRFFPKISKLLAIKKYLPLKLLWVKEELPSLLIALICIMGIEAWQDVFLSGRKKFFEEALGFFLTITLFSFFTAFFLLKQRQHDEKKDCLRNS